MVSDTQPVNVAGALGSDEERRETVSPGVLRRLAARLNRYRGGRAIVLALPPNGVGIAAELAAALRLSMEIMAARTFYLPVYPELAAGALTECGGLCLNRAILQAPGVTLEKLWDAARQAHDDVEAQIAFYRSGRPLPVCMRRPLLLVDDDIDTGLVELAAIQALRQLHPHHIVVVAPHGSSTAVALIAPYAEVIVAELGAPQGDSRLN